jgi:hypothetical protein
VLESAAAAAARGFHLSESRGLSQKAKESAKTPDHWTLDHENTGRVSHIIFKFINIINLALHSTNSIDFHCIYDPLRYYSCPPWTGRKYTKSAKKVAD